MKRGGIFELVERYDGYRMWSAATFQNFAESLAAPLDSRVFAAYFEKIAKSKIAIPLNATSAD